ncbi:MAG: hypothetical protein AB1696_29085 [Planctomycetota bacterium]
MQNRGKVIAFVLCWATMALAQPVVKNPSFEADKFGKSPGTAKANGGAITGWTFKGNVGVNPWWDDAANQKGPNQTFSDNGRFPHGRQTALMQNQCTLSQKLEGFKGGKKYIVTYHENARCANWTAEGPPKIVVTLGGETIVSEHPVAPVDKRDERTLPFDFVESAVFTAPRDGAYDLVFTTTVNNRVTILIDDVRIMEAR